jgi:hypothetical protein
VINPSIQIRIRGPGANLCTDYGTNAIPFYRKNPPDSPISRAALRFAVFFAPVTATFPNNPNESIFTLRLSGLLSLRMTDFLEPHSR